MKAVALEEVKDDPSKYLRLAEKGEIIDFRPSFDWIPPSLKEA